MKRAVPVHPFLLAIFPVVFLTSHNIHEVRASDSILPGAIILGVTGVLFVVLGWLGRDRHKAALFLSIVLVLFFSYGHVSRSFLPFNPYATAVHLMSIWILLIALSAVMVFRCRRDLYGITGFLNVLAGSFVVISLLNIGIYKLNHQPSAEAASRDPVEKLGDPQVARDIYYIVLDGYGSTSMLKEIYDFDNREFIEDLEDRGFFVASQSLANYSQTVLSIGSALSMDYLNHLTDVLGEDSLETKIPRRMAWDSKVVRLLKSKDYKFVSFGSTWGLRGEYANADWNSPCTKELNEFEINLLRGTMLSHLEPYFWNGHAEKILCTFEQLGEVHEISGPKFIFAHIVSPHKPFVFDAEGNRVPEDVRQSRLRPNPWRQTEDVLNQHLFINKKLTALFDEIFAASEVAPIIIVHSDHGTASTFEIDEHGQWTNATDVALKERMRNFCALYLPDGGAETVYESVTPVNIMRLVFNHYFDADLEILEDRSYFSYYSQPYKFTDVTDVVAYE